MFKFLSLKAFRVYIAVAVIFNVALYSPHHPLPAADDVASNIKNNSTDRMLNLWQPNIQNVSSDFGGALMNRSDTKPVVVAYAISLIKCQDIRSTTAGLIDAAIVLRHSVHLMSIRNPESRSKYDYKMYAIVHRDAEPCSHVLRDVGYQIILVDTPVTKKEMQSEYLQKNIHREKCCGEHEFIKLYAYTLLDHPIVVHVDIDFTFRLPMDDLFDAMLYNSTSPEGIQARSRIPIERPGIDKLPDKIDFYMTRDWSFVNSLRPTGFQAGLMILRPNMNSFNTILDVIRNEKYVGGVLGKNGWGGKGTSSFLSAFPL